MTIAVIKHAKLDNKLLKSCPTLLDFSTLYQIFCPGLCKGLHQLWALTCDLWDAMPCQRSLTLSHVTYRMPCHARGHLHSHMWLMGCHAMPEVTYILKSDFWNAMPSQRSLTLSHVTYGAPCHTRGHLHSYLGKQKISLEVVIILRHILAYLGWLQPIYYNSWPIFIKTVKILLVVKTLMKNIKQQLH